MKFINCHVSGCTRRAVTQFGTEVAGGVLVSWYACDLHAKRYTRALREPAAPARPEAMTWPKPPACDCHLCWQQPVFGGYMVVCRVCGNKRCPKAEDHRFACTGSNEPGQVGVLEAPSEPAGPKLRGVTGDERGGNVEVVTSAGNTGHVAVGKPRPLSPDWSPGNPGPEHNGIGFDSRRRR